MRIDIRGIQWNDGTSTADYTSIEDSEIDGFLKVKVNHGGFSLINKDQIRKILLSDRTQIDK